MSDHPTWWVTRHRYGLTVRGKLPVRDLDGVAKIAAAWGYDLVDAMISGHIGATMVFVSAETSAAWRAELGVVDG